MVRVLSSLTLLAVATTATSASVNAAPRLDANVHRALRQQGTVNLMITMASGTKEALESFNEVESVDRGAFITNLVDKLEEQARKEQKEIQSLLNQEAFGDDFESFKSFWISNQVYVKGARASFIQKALKLKGISEIREEIVLPLMKPIIEVAAVNSTINDIEWGVDKVGAPKAWANGNHGENIVVASIDTGVLGTHEILKDSYRGAYGWFDPEKKAEAPYDPQGHGTHTMGTIAGQNGVGVAPGAKWMACKGCRSDGCSEADLLACAEFMTCPTDTKGENKDCSKAPHVINNSWGGGQGDTFYKAAVDAWLKAGIVPIFSNGNSGPSCNTANSPADMLTVIGVGATDVNDGLGSFSSKGPTVAGQIKPDISAPGVKVRSSTNSGDSAYAVLSGTSMAAPHTTGVVALILNSNPSMSFEELKKVLFTNVDISSLKPSNQKCGGTADTTYPNNQFGYGRISVAKALKL